MNGTDRKTCYSEKLITDEKWYYIALVWDGKSQSIFIDGELDKSSFVGEFLLSKYKKNLCITSYEAEIAFHGTVDEVQMCNISRSSGWIQTAFNNQNDISGFFTVHQEEQQDLPSKPIIKGPKSGKAGKLLTYSFMSTDPNGSDIFYYIDWGDGDVEEWIGPFSSGEEINIDHKWSEKGNFTISAKARDTFNAESDWSEFEVTIPRTRPITFERLLESFPLLERLLTFIIEI
jgi:hypothetical protein